MIGDEAAIVAADKELPSTATELRAIPYFLWANREVGPMRVWVPESVR